MEDDPTYVEHALNPRRYAASGRHTRSDRVRSAGGKYIEPPQLTSPQVRQAEPYGGLMGGLRDYKGSVDPSGGRGSDYDTDMMSATVGDPFEATIGDIVGTGQLSRAVTQGALTGYAAATAPAAYNLSKNEIAKYAGTAFGTSLVGPASMIEMSLRGIAKGEAQEAARAATQEALDRSIEAGATEAGIQGEIDALGKGELSFAEMSDEAKDVLSTMAEGVEMGKNPSATAGLRSLLGMIPGFNTVAAYLGETFGGLDSVFGETASIQGTAENPELAAVGRYGASAQAGKTAPHMAELAKRMQEDELTIKGREIEVPVAPHWSYYQQQALENLVPLPDWWAQRKERQLAEAGILEGPNYTVPDYKTLPQIEKLPMLQEGGGGAGDLGLGGGRAGRDVSTSGQQDASGLGGGGYKGGGGEKDYGYTGGGMTDFGFDGPDGSGRGNDRGERDFGEGPGV